MLIKASPVVLLGQLGRSRAQQACGRLSKAAAEAFAATWQAGICGVPCAWQGVCSATMRHAKAAAADTSMPRGASATGCIRGQCSLAAINRCCWPATRPCHAARVAGARAPRAHPHRGDPDRRHLPRARCGRVGPHAHAAGHRRRRQGGCVARRCQPSVGGTRASSNVDTSDANGRAELGTACTGDACAWATPLGHAQADRLSPLPCA